MIHITFIFAIPHFKADSGCLFSSITHIICTGQMQSYLPLVKSMAFQCKVWFLHKLYLNDTQKLKVPGLVV